MAAFATQPQQRTLLSYTGGTQVSSGGLLGNSNRFISSGYQPVSAPSVPLLFDQSDASGSPTNYRNQGSARFLSQTSPMVQASPPLPLPMRSSPSTPSTSMRQLSNTSQVNTGNGARIVKDSRWPSVPSTWNLSSIDNAVQSSLVMPTSSSSEALPMMLTSSQRSVAGSAPSSMRRAPNSTPGPGSGYTPGSTPIPDGEGGLSRSNSYGGLPDAILSRPRVAPGSGVGLRAKTLVSRDAIKRPQLSENANGMPSGIAGKGLASATAGRSIPTIEEVIVANAGAALQYAKAAAAVAPTCRSSDLASPGQLPFNPPRFGQPADVTGSSNQIPARRSDAEAEIASACTVEPPPMFNEQLPAYNGIERGPKQASASIERGPKQASASKGQQAATASGRPSSAGQRIWVIDWWPNPKFNGQEGTTIRWLEQEGCWEVALADGSSGVFKPENLQVLGQRVRIVGHTLQPGLNGQEGNVSYWGEADGLCQVRMADGMYTVLHVDHLEILPWIDQAADRREPTVASLERPEFAQQPLGRASAGQAPSFAVNDEVVEVDSKVVNVEARANEEVVEVMTPSRSEVLCVFAQENGFTGAWSGKGTIKDGKLRWTYSGDTISVLYLDATTVRINLKGKKYTGRLRPSGDLEWDDDDTWEVGAGHTWTQPQTAGGKHGLGYCLAGVCGWVMPMPAGSVTEIEKRC